MMQTIDRFIRRLDNWSVAYPYRTAFAMCAVAIGVAVLANYLHLPVFYARGGQ